MYSILTRAGCFISIILLGYVLRRVGFFVKEDFALLSRIVIRITLTAAVISSFSGRELEASMLLFTLLGFGFGVLMMLCGYLAHRRQDREAQAFAVLNTTGCNIGTFVFPFAQGFLGPAGVMAVVLFDVGNGLLCLGGAYGVARTIRSGEKFSLLPVLRIMAKSIPLITYITMTVLSLARISLPGPVIDLAGIIGGGNAFLAMLTLGVGFQLGSDRSQLAEVLRILVPRFSIGILFSVLSFTVLPLPLEYRQALAILFLSPISSAAPSFTAEMGGDYGLASAVNSIAILISIVLIVTALVIVL